MTVRMTVRALQELRTSIQLSGMVRADVYSRHTAHPSRPIAWARDRFGDEHYLCLWNAGDYDRVYTSPIDGTVESPLDGATLARLQDDIEFFDDYDDCEEN